MIVFQQKSEPITYDFQQYVLLEKLSPEMAR